jgi:hypothetical protein
MRVGHLVLGQLHCGIRIFFYRHRNFRTEHVLCGIPTWSVTYGD